MNLSLANILTSVSEDIFLISSSIIAAVFIGICIAIIWLSRALFKLKRECAALTTIVEANKNDIYGLCSAALTVNENTANTHEQLHDLKKQLAHVVDKISELESAGFVNGAYNGDIRKIREGASVEQLMKQSELSYDEAALLIRLHGGTA